jgi:hypothetical protein
MKCGSRRRRIGVRDLADEVAAESVDQFFQLGLLIWLPAR